MEIAALPSDLTASEIPLERLAGNGHLSEEQKITEAARQFEAVLLRQILASTQKTVIPSEFTDNSTAADIYRDMITTQLADSISKSGTFGLAKTLEQQLQHQARPASSAGHALTPQPQPTSLAGAEAVRLHFDTRPHSLNGQNATKGSDSISHERPAAQSH